MKPLDLERDPVWKIYEGLAAESEAAVKSYYKPGRRFRASEIKDCRRKIWYRLAGFVPFPKKPWLELVAGAGNLYHDYYRYLANHFEVGMTGVTFNEDGSQDEMDNLAKDFTYDGKTFTLSCRADGFQDLPGNITAVKEIKTMTTFQFEKLQSAWKTAGNAGAIEWLEMNKPSYLWQGNQTALITGKKHVYLLCIDRNLNRIGLSDIGFGEPHAWDPLAGNRAGGAVWEVEERDGENILAKAAHITECLYYGKPPAADYSASSTECKQCDFFIYCHGKKKKMEYPLKGVLDG